MELGQNNFVQMLRYIRVKHQSEIAVKSASKYNLICAYESALSQDAVDICDTCDILNGAAEEKYQHVLRRAKEKKMN